MTGLEALSADFEAEYRASLQRNRVAKLEMTPAIKGEIIELAKREIKPTFPNTQYQTTVSGRPMTYHVLLAETPVNIQVFEMKYGPKVTMRWNGSPLGCFLTPQQIEQLEPNTPYILVGKLKITTGIGKYEGRTFYNFSAQHVITMDEIKAHTEAQKSQDEQISDKINAHK